jgi:hypothetical protein
MRPISAGTVFVEIPTLVAGRGEIIDARRHSLFDRSLNRPSILIEWLV